ncbi:hypothetical protein FLM55_02625 [Francisella sp. Scap27]|uniref:protein adenylyltransferase SelO n=1 Tax=Francisella sp. Scap27 TaxID=2589986 RepID=UPI0015C10A98|nr:protein adenylyltransferase SelO family protein [Francisella sp. Scap27]QLE78695.1 hypothetical protein FLM55_02625 [Francisella sp. Scap27]
MIDLNQSYKELSQEFYTPQGVYKYPNAKIVIFNDELAKELGIKFDDYSTKEKLDFLLGYSAKQPIAQAYAGHQFGHFTTLGDGRAILLGECKNSEGDSVDIQLKGAGRTAYSRGGDGKAPLGAMLREYIVSEAMYNLEIPTSRILAVITTGENIQRNTLEQGAIAVRVASSHVRVGTFQYAATLSENHSQELLDYTIKRHNIPYEDNKALGLLDFVIDKQSTLITEWERVGFIHGVMNTDNMTISGETIDYGPCAFINKYDPQTVFSSIDRRGRYAFANQANIAGWNIARLAESVLPLIDSNQDKAVETAQQRLDNYAGLYTKKWQRMMSNKFGLESFDDKEVSEYLAKMQSQELDYTNSFIDLTHTRQPILEVMKNSNPTIIPRNHQVNKAIKLAEDGNYSFLNNFVATLKKPYGINQKTKFYNQSASHDEDVEFTFCGT